MIDFSKLVDADYYLTSNPGGDFLLGYLLFLFFIGLLFLESTYAKKASHDKYFKKSMRNRFWKFYFLGGIGIALVLARFAAVPSFSMRLWLYLTFIGSVVILAMTHFNIQKEYKKRLGSVEREKSKKK